MISWSPRKKSVVLYFLRGFSILVIGSLILFYLWDPEPSVCPYCPINSQSNTTSQSWGQWFSALVQRFSPRKSHVGYTPVGFNILSSYNYKQEPVKSVSTSTSKTEEEIPSSIKALNGRKVAIRGYIVPVMVLDGETKSFMLMRSTMMCCYGIMPKINERVDVEMENTKNTNLSMDIPMLVYGTLDIGERYDDGVLMSIYRMKADKVVETY